MGSQVRNLFSALAEDPTIDLNSDNGEHENTMSRQEASDRRETRSHDTKQASENKEHPSTKRSGRHEKDEKATDSGESEAGLRRSNRANKGRQKEVFDPSHIPSPKRRINMIVETKEMHDDNEDDGNTDVSSDSGAMIEENEKHGRKRPAKKDEDEEEDIGKSEGKGKRGRKRSVKKEVEEKSGKSEEKGKRGRKRSVKKEEEEKEEESAKSEESDSDSDETNSSYNDPKKLWCICKKPHNGRFMISCDVCEEWFHGDCVGISVYRGKQMEKKGEEYVCPSCIKNKGKKGKGSKTHDTKPKVGVKLKGYAYSKEPKEATPTEKRKSKDPATTEKAKSKISQGELDVKQRKCIVSTCPNKAQPESVYCSNVCILRHAKESLGGIEKLTKQGLVGRPPIQRQESKEERILRKIKEAASRGKVAVMCLKTGKIFANASAPLKEDLETFLKQNPTFQKLKLSKSVREKLQQKEPVQKPKIEHSQQTKTEPHQKPKIEHPKMEKMKPPKEHNLQKKDILMRQSSDPDYKPQDKQFSNPYKQFTPISPRDEKAIAKAKKHKMQRQDSSEIKRPKHKLESERRHSADKNAAGKITPSKRDNRSVSEDKSSKKDAPSQNEKEVRKNVQKSLQGILEKRSNNSEDLKMHPDSISRLVVKVEDALHKLFGGVNAKYKNRYRSIMFNLKDEKNHGLWRKVILGEVTSSRLVKMTAEEMASKELAQWRKHELTQELEMIHDLEVAKQSFRPVAKITHKGEIAINEDYSDLTESHLDTSGEKSTPTIAPQRMRRISMNQPELVEDTSLQSMDTTSEHNNHLFDMNCMICTGQIKEEDARLEDTSAKAVKHSTSIILSNEAQRPVEKETDEEIINKINSLSKMKEKSDAGLAKPESEEPEEKAETPPESPENITPPENGSESNTPELKKTLPLKRKPSWENFLWTGTITMPELSSFRSNAYTVSGSGQELINIIPHKLVLDGRIHPRVVWEYLTKVRTFPNKEVCVIQFRASSEEDRVGYVSMLSYFSSRKRFGVVSNQNTQVIKDIYLAPLLEGENVPKPLLPFRGPGIPADHPSMLLGIIVRCVPETKKSFRDIESRIAKISDIHVRKHRISDISLTGSPTDILPKSVTPTPPQKILQESPKEVAKNDEDEEYNPETADFGNILDDETPTSADASLGEDDEEAYDPEKLVFDDEDSGSTNPKPDDEDDAPYDPEEEAERLESTEVKALQEKQALLEKMKHELEQKKAELAKEEMSLQQVAPGPVLKPTKTVSQPPVDPRIAARLNKSKATAEPENPLQKIFSVLNIERPGSM